MKIIEIVHGERVEKYCCERCGHKTTNKNSLINHFKRINQCLPVNRTVSVNKLLEQYTKKYDYRCDDCLKFYKSKGSLRKHVCRAKKVNSEIAETEATNVETTDIATTNAEATDAEATDTSTQETTPESSEDIPIVIDRDDAILMDLEQPYVEYINEDFLIDNYLSGPNIIPLLAKMIYFNKDYPQNHVCFIKNKTRSTAYIYMNESWQTVPCSYVLNLIFKTVRSLIFVAYNKALNEYVAKSSEYETLLVDQEEYFKDKYIVKQNLIGTDADQMRRNILKMMENKRDSLNQQIDLLNARSKCLQTLYASLTRKRDYHYSKYLKQIKQHLTEFDMIVRHTKNINEIHPITGQHCISFRRLVEEEAQRRLAQLLRRDE